MATRPQILLIDGYNLLHFLHPAGFPDKQTINRARDTLIADLRGLQGSIADQTLAVFDGAGETVSREESGPAFGVAYSKRNQSADALIEKMVLRHPSPSEVLVVSSDRAIATLARASGCQTESVYQFSDRLRDSRSSQTKALARSRRKPPTLGDLFPENGKS